MGRPLPGYRVALIDPWTGEQAWVRFASIPAARPLALMVEAIATTKNATPPEAMSTAIINIVQLASRDGDGYITYVGRTDDVFKARLTTACPPVRAGEHPDTASRDEAVAEAAVVPSPDPLRLALPKAYIVLAAG